MLYNLQCTTAMKAVFLYGEYFSLMAAFMEKLAFLLTRLHYSAAAVCVFGMEAFSCYINESTGSLPFDTSVLVFSS